MGEPRRKLVWIDRAGARRLTWLFVALAAVDSIPCPLWLKMPGKRYVGPFEPLTADELELRDVLHETVCALAGTIGERSILTGNGLKRAEGWLGGPSAPTVLR